MNYLKFAQKYRKDGRVEVVFRLFLCDFEV